MMRDLQRATIALSRLSVRSTTPGSAPKRRTHSAWLMSATGGAPRTSSSGAKSRPSATRTPSTRKKVVLDAVAPQAFRLALGDLARPGDGAHRRHRLERRRRRVPLLHVEPVGHRLGLAREHERDGDPPDGDEAIGIRVRQRPEEHAVERGEERRGGAEAEAQHEDGRQRERRAGAATSAR